MKVKLFGISTNCDNYDLKKIETKINKFLVEHKIKEIHQSGAGAGGGSFSEQGTHLISIFYDD